MVVWLKIWWVWMIETSAGGWCAVRISLVAATEIQALSVVFRICSSERTAGKRCAARISLAAAREIRPPSVIYNEHNNQPVGDHPGGFGGGKQWVTPAGDGILWQIAFQWRIAANVSEFLLAEEVFPGAGRFDEKNQQVWRTQFFSAWVLADFRSGGC